MGLLDADRFEGRSREGAHKVDVSDLMRRLTKEELRSSTARRFSRAQGLYDPVPALGPRSAALRGGHPVRAQRDAQPQQPGGDDKRRVADGYEIENVVAATGQEAARLNLPDDCVVLLA